MRPLLIAACCICLLCSRYAVAAKPDSREVWVKASDFEPAIDSDVLDFLGQLEKYCHEELLKATTTGRSSDLLACRAQARHGLHKNREALEDAVNAIELNPGNAHARIVYTSILSSLGKQREALTQLEAIDTDDRLADEATLMRAVIYTRSDREVEALQELDKVIDKIEMAYLIRASTYLTVGRASDALADIEMYMATRRYGPIAEPGRPHVLHALAYEQQQDPSGVRAELAKAVDVDPHSMRTFFVVVRLATEREEYDSAQKAAELMQRYAPDEVATEQALGYALYSAGQPKLAIPHLAKAHTAFPNDRALLGFLISSYLAVDDYPQAMAMVQQEPAAHSNSHDYAFWLAALEIKGASGESECSEAWETLERIGRDPLEDAERRFQIASLMAFKGKREQAKQLLRTVHCCGSSYEQILEREKLLAAIDKGEAIDVSLVPGGSVAWKKIYIAFRRHVEPHLR